MTVHLRIIQYHVLYNLSKIKTNYVDISNICVIFSAIVVYYSIALEMRWRSNAILNVTITIYVRDVTKTVSLIFRSQFPESTLTLVFSLSLAHVPLIVLQKLPQLSKCFSGLILFCIFLHPGGVQKNTKKYQPFKTFFQPYSFLGTIAGACTKLQRKILVIIVVHENLPLKNTCDYLQCTQR